MQFLQHNLDDVRVIQHHPIWSILLLKEFFFLKHYRHCTQNTPTQIRRHFEICPLHLQRNKGNTTFPLLATISAEYIMFGGSTTVPFLPAHHAYKICFYQKFLQGSKKERKQELWARSKLLFLNTKPASGKVSISKSQSSRFHPPPVSSVRSCSGMSKI